MKQQPPRYPRNLHGYGARAPDPKWPGGAKLAVQFVVNYEEGGENCLLHGDPASEAFLSETIGVQPWPGQRHWNMETIYEYGARAGFWRLHRLFTELDVPVTIYGVATALARGPAQVEAMQQAGWEIASHGLKWIEYKDFSPEEERAHMAEAIRLHREVTGERPFGWYTGRCSEHTVDLVAEEGGFLYCADSYADELPYWQPVADGGHQLIVPYTLDANDMRFASPQGFNSGDQFFSYVKDSFDVLYAEGKAGAAKMMSIGLHCRLVGRPGRPALEAQVLADALDVGHELGRVVLVHRRIEVVADVGDGLTGSPLVEEHDSVVLRIEEAANPGRAASARASMQEQGRYALRVSGLLDVQGVSVADVEVFGAEGLGQFGHVHSWGQRRSIRTWRAHGTPVVYGLDLGIGHHHAQVDLLESRHSTA